MSFKDDLNDIVKERGHVGAPLVSERAGDYTSVRIDTETSNALCDIFEFSISDISWAELQKGIKFIVLAAHRHVFNEANPEAPPAVAERAAQTQSSLVKYAQAGGQSLSKAHCDLCDVGYGSLKAARDCESERIRQCLPTPPATMKFINDIRKENK